MTTPELIAYIKSGTPKVSEELLDAYYGEGDECVFGDWASGNFNDDVSLGIRIGAYEAYQDILNKLEEMQ